MSDVNIIGSVQIDTGESAKRLSDLSQEIKTQSKAWKDAKVGSDEYVIAQQKLKIASEEYNKVAAEVNATQDKSGEAFSILKGKLGDAVPGFKGASEGAQGFGVQLKVLMANPIILILTAIVGALAFLYEAFTSTKEGAKKMEVAMAAAGAVVKNITDRTLALGRIVIDFFTGDWKKLGDDVKIVSGNAGNSMTQAVNGAMDSTKRLQDLRKKMANQDVEDAKNAANIAKLRDEAMDETIPLKKRMEAQKEVSKIDKENADRKKANAKEEYEANLEKWKTEANGEQNHAQELRELKKKEYEAETEASNNERRINMQGRRMEREEKTKEREAEKVLREKAKAEKDNQKAFDDKILKAKQEEELASIKDTYEKELKQLEFKILEEKKLNSQNYEDKKITKAQLSALNIEVVKVNNAKRIELLDKHNKDILKAQQDFKKQLAEIIKGTNTSEETDQRKKELASLKADMEAKTKAILDNEKFTFSQKEILLAALSNEQKAKEDAINKKFDDEHIKAKEQLSLKEISAEMKAGKKKFDLQVSLINQKQKIESAMYAREIKEAKGNADKIDEINQRRTESEKANTEARIEAKKKEMEFMLSEVGAVGNALSTMSDIAGKQTAAGKAMSIAATTIKTIQGGISAFLGMVDEIPGPVGIALGAVAAAGVVASGVKSVQDITKVEVPGQGGGGSVPNISVNSPVLPSPVQTSTSLNSSSIQGIGNAASNAGRAFVLDRDIKDNAERDAVLTRRARLG